MSTEPLASLCELNPETLGASTPTDFTFRYLDISAVAEGRIDWSSMRAFSFGEAPSRARRVVRKGDVLLCTVRPGLKAHARIRTEDPTPLVASTGYAVLRPNEAGDSGYVFHQLFSDGVARQLRAMETGSNYPAVNEGDVRRIVFDAPEAPERERIAAVLDTLDDAIDKTEAVIAKLKQVRAGLLHDLLTRGLDEHGQLRDPVRHPEQFQDSPLGRIPRACRISGVLDVPSTDRQAILTGPFGAQLGQRDFVIQGVPVLRIGNVQAGYIDWSDTQHVSLSKAVELQRFTVRPGDLLFARQGATTGRNALADARADGALINYHIIRVAVDRNLCEPIFLHAIFNSEQALRQINRDKGRGTREGINTEQISSLRFALPSIEEQRRTVSVLARHDGSVDAEAVLVAKLQHLKSGLLFDLLTGRVRVPEDLLEGIHHGQ